MSCDPNKHCSGDCRQSKLLSKEELPALFDKLQGWELVEGRRLRKQYGFPDFATALAFTNKLGELAERLGHHPDIYLSWGKVQVEIWTHSKNGLTLSDFALAEQADLIPSA